MATTTQMTTAQKRRSTARHESFLRHRSFFYLKVALGLCALAILGYALIDVEPRHNGGSWYGYILGTLGAGIIVWLALLGVRKRAITPGNWSLKAWTSAHVYLGLSLIVVGTLHTGFQFGWNVHTLAYVLMMLVIISGAFGIYFYVRIPRQMSDNRAETSQAEMLEEIASINREMRDAARPLDEDCVREVERSIQQSELGRSFTTRLTGFDPKCGTADAIKAMREYSRKSSGDTRVAADAVVALLERKSALLRRARTHVRYRMLLELWLYTHVPVTFGLLVALTAHIISVFFYW